MKAAAPTRLPITDSPWFWACLFSSIGLVSLVAIAQKYDARQTIVERKAQARLRAAEQETSGEITTEVTSRGNLGIPIQPLFAILGVVLVGSWGMLWWHHLRGKPSEKIDTTSTENNRNSNEQVTP